MGNLRSLAVLLAISLGIFSAEPNAEELPLSPLLNPDNQDRLLLVAFSDSHIDRIQLSASPTVYRRRGPYRSSTWGREVTTRIQERYGLVKLDEWPMTEIGLHCAVYLVPENHSVQETVELLSQDDEVDVVQRMHQFTTEGHRYNDPYYRLQLNMQEMNIEKAQERATGKDITVALIDTGVELDHPDLAGQFKLTKNFVQPNSGEFQED
ncbi:MAG: S8 family serine peptidase, partial [Gammaproteobacteria bacterium]